MDWEQTFRLAKSPKGFLVALAESLSSHSMTCVSYTNPTWRTYPLNILIESTRQRAGHVVVEFTPNGWATLRVTDSTREVLDSHKIIEEWWKQLPDALSKVTGKNQPARIIRWTPQGTQIGKAETFSARLVASESEFVSFVENEIEQSSSASDFFTDSPYAPRSYAEAEGLQYPPRLLFTRRVTYSRNPTPDEKQYLDSAWQHIQDTRIPGFLYLKTLWEGNQRATYVATSTGGVWRESFGGYVEYSPLRAKSGNALDISISCADSILRDYWEWLARRLLIRFAFGPKYKAGTGRPRGKRPKTAKQDYNRILNLRNSSKWRLANDKDFLRAYPQYSRSKLSRAKRWAAEGRP